MRIAILLAFFVAISGCTTSAVIKEVENTEACGAGTARLIPTEADVWLILCHDGRVSWMADEKADAE